MVREGIYQNHESPYLKLLKIAGCEFADLQAEFRRHGLESSLATLAGEGVYLTSEEFKGKIEVVRGREAFRVSPEDFEIRESSAGFNTQSSGARNAPVSTFSRLQWRALQAMGVAVFYSAHDLLSSAHAIYEPIIAGRMNFVLINNNLEIPTDRWFAIRVPAYSMP